MNYTNKFVEVLSEMDRRGEPCIAVTLVSAVGSTPQDTGSKMLVDQNGLAFGTVGGGRIERKALDVAGEMIRERAASAHFVEWNLQRDVGMTCGGVVKLFFEPYNQRRWPIVVFGAGHVAQSLIRALLSLDCQITCIDQRQDWLDRLPDALQLSKVQAEHLADRVPDLDERSFILCMTMGHASDRPVLERIFRERRCFPYLGVIGSDAKRKVLVRELVDAGIEKSLAEQFQCPIGLPFGNNQPAEIAISIIAQLIQCRDRLQADSTE